MALLRAEMYAAAALLLHVKALPAWMACAVALAAGTA